MQTKQFSITPTLLTDGYKMDHRRQYIPGTRFVTANMTPRKSRVKGINSVVVFGTQYYILSTLIERWNRDFFQRPIEEITVEYMEEMTEYTLSEQSAKDIGVDHWIALHKLGYLPLEIKALKEGTECPIKVPVYMVRNTHPDFFWLTNFIETDMSAETWGMMTSATLANAYRKLFTKWAITTGGDLGFVPFQGHNFSYRGMLGREAAAIVDMGHCTSFVGSDTMHGRQYLKRYYFGKQNGFNNIISCSVFATEHAVMCTSTGFYITKDNLNWERYGEAEYKVFKRLITELYPNGIVSIVSDTWDLWKVLLEYMVQLKSEIMARNGKVVIRPDSGDPVDIMCGVNRTFGYQGTVDIPENKGVVELLWDVFGGTEVTGADGNKYKVLDPHIGAIYGDSINLERADQICGRLFDKGFCSTNWVAGVGSYTYQYVTRDTFGFAQKATFAEIEIDNQMYGIEVFKNPKTDDGTKKSARGRLAVRKDENGVIYLKDQCTEEEEKDTIMETVFLDGTTPNLTNLEAIRSLIRSQDEVIVAA